MPNELVRRLRIDRDRYERELSDCPEESNRHPRLVRRIAEIDEAIERAGAPARSTGRPRAAF